STSTSAQASATAWASGEEAPKSAAAAVTVACAKVWNCASGATALVSRTWYQIPPACSQAWPPRARAGREKAGLGMPEVRVAAPLVGGDAAVVGGGAHVAAHGGRLLVAVERRSRRLHGAQGSAVQRRTQDARPDQPVGLVRRLAQPVLLDQRAEHVRDG